MRAARGIGDRSSYGSGDEYARETMQRHASTVTAAARSINQAFTHVLTVRHERNSRAPVRRASYAECPVLSDRVDRTATTNSRSQPCSSTASPSSWRSIVDRGRGWNRQDGTRSGRSSPQPGRVATACCAAPVRKPRPVSRSPASPIWPVTLSTRCAGGCRSSSRRRSTSPCFARSRGRGVTPTHELSAWPCATCSTGSLERRPTLVVVDDVGWLDSATANALGFAARRIDGQRIGFVTTVRLPADDVDPLGLRRAFGDDNTTALALGPLDVDALIVLIERQVGTRFAQPVFAASQPPPAAIRCSPWRSPERSALTCRSKQECRCPFPTTCASWWHGELRHCLTQHEPPCLPPPR